nr:hypothetical protein [Gemmatimonadota bacterium]NIQ54499.1 hypothetical protein [Gemmatimonadota bacterium]NIU74705.1 hypothetical protein [Gammaproteobacteria bacterium]NIX44630.1 hypothetical protein [Gemmatimonadota bacterium]NIY08855.1 hypothetical protein [Gemmatimonadota bacterium]
MRPDDHDTTELLARVRTRDPEAVSRLFSLVYEELRGLARAQRRRWEGDQTLCAVPSLSEK